jgi:biopolymer transport protein ExbB
MSPSFSDSGVKTAFGTLRQWLELGGPVVLILAAMSMLALAVVLLKLYQFARIGTAVPSAVGHAVEAFRTQHLADAERLLQGERGLAALIVGRTIDAARTPSFDAVAARENVTRLAADHLAALRHHFRTLEMIASLAPLLGLFGTVLGMIEAFRALQAGGSRIDPSLLSGGIWEALLTTAVGLAVAMPTVAVLNLMEQRVDHFGHQLDSLISRLFTSEGDARKPRPAACAPSSTDADLAPLPGA